MTEEDVDGFVRGYPDLIGSNPDIGTRMSQVGAKPDVPSGSGWPWGGSVVCIRVLPSTIRNMGRLRVSTR